MDREDIIRMALEAGIGEHDGCWTTDDDPDCLYPEAVYTKNLERFAALVAAAEREACAKVCDTEADNPSCLWEEPGCWKHAAENCAGSIRARGENK